MIKPYRALEHYRAVGCKTKKVGKNKEKKSDEGEEEEDADLMETKPSSEGTANFFLLI